MEEPPRSPRPAEQGEGQGEGSVSLSPAAAPDDGPAVSPAAGSTALLHLLHLASPALPVGAFAYSQGQEHAVHVGAVRDEGSAGEWILGLLAHTLRTLEVPALARLRTAWAAGDLSRMRAWNDFVFASRGSNELQAEDRRVGGALARVLQTVGVAAAAPWTDDPRGTYVNMFALACAHFRLDERAGATALLFSWCENQVAAAMRLVPLGQSSGQRILARAIQLIPSVVEEGLALPDLAMAQGAPGLALGSALHETQYSRIFRS